MNSKPITLTNDGTVYTLTLGKDVCPVTKNGKSSQIELEYAPTMKDGTTYIPLDFVMTI